MPQGTARALVFPLGPAAVHDITGKAAQRRLFDGAEACHGCRCLARTNPPVPLPRPPCPRDPHTHFTQRWKPPPWPTLPLDPCTAVMSSRGSGGSEEWAVSACLPREALLLLFTNQLWGQVSLAARTEGDGAFFFFSFSFPVALTVHTPFI